MKKLLIVLLFASCNKQPLKECWTVEGYKMVQVVPSVYQVTFKSGNKTKLVRQASPPVIGSNTCDSDNHIQFNLLP